MHEKVGKSRNTVFPIIWGSGGSKSRLAKAAGAEPAGQMRDEKLQAVVARSTFPSEKVQNIVAPLLEVEMSKKCTPLWREANFQVKMYKAHHGRTTFGSWDVENLHAAVARSTFPSQNVQSTPWSDHFWKLKTSVYNGFSIAMLNNQMVGVLQFWPKPLLCNEHFPMTYHWNSPTATASQIHPSLSVKMGPNMA